MKNGIKSLPNLTKSKNESYSNWMNRRKACIGLLNEQDVYIDPFPERVTIEGKVFLQYPHFRVLDGETGTIPYCEAIKEFKPM